MCKYSAIDSALLCKFLSDKRTNFGEPVLPEVVRQSRSSEFIVCVANPVSSNEYVAYSSECVYLNDNTAFIDKPHGTSRYLATIRYKGVDYGLREYAELGSIYCDNRPDNSFKTKLSVTTNDHRINYVMLKRNDFFLSNLRFYFEQGCFRFKDLRCKEAILKALSY